MGDEEKIIMSQVEFDQAIKIAVQEQRLGNLAEAFENHEKKEDEYLKEIFDKVREVQQDMSEWPLKISQCRDDLEKDIAKEFVSDKVFKLEMKRMDTKIEDQWKRITVSVIVAFAAIQFAFKLWGG